MLDRGYSGWGKTSNKSPVTIQCGNSVQRTMDLLRRPNPKACWRKWNPRHPHRVSGGGGRAFRGRKVFLGWSRVCAGVLERNESGKGHRSCVSDKRGLLGCEQGIRCDQLACNWITLTDGRKGVKARAPREEGNTAHQAGSLLKLREAFPCQAV